jgi:hypothetical protein
VVALGGEAFEQDRALVDASEAFGECPQDVAVDAVDGAPGGVVVGVEESDDFSGGDHGRCDIGGCACRRDERCVGAGVFGGADDAGGAVALQQLAFEGHLAERDTRGRHPLVVARADVAVGEVGDPGHPRSAVDAAEHRAGEAAVADDLQADVVDELC